MTGTEIVLLDAVIGLLTEGLAAGPADRARHLSNLCLAHRERHRCGGGPADLDRAVEIGEAAIAAATDGDPNRAAYLSNLGIALRERYTRLDDPRDLDRSVEVGEQALAATPDEHPDHALYLSKLGTAYRLRAERHGSRADAERAVEFGTRAVASTPDDPMFLANLGNAYVERFEHSRDPADLDRAIEVGEQAAAHGAGLANLGGAYQQRYERDGNPADLDRAIELGEQAVTETPKQHHRLAGYLSNLGGAYQQRYERNGALADLDHAVRIGEQAVTAAPRDHPKRAMCLSNLGLAAWKRYLRGENPADLDRAIEAGEQAVAVTRPDDPARVAMRSNLGSAYLARFADSRAAADIDHAVDAAREVVETVPDSHPDRATYLSNLGNTYLQRYEHRRADDDLHRALDAAERAVTTSGPEHPARATHLANLCVILLRRYDRTGIPVESLGRLIEWVDEVTAAGTATPTSLIKAGHRLGALAHAMNDQAAAVALLRDAVALLPVAVATQTERGDQEHRLGAHWGMIGEAVAAHCAANDPVGAVETAELGRGILLASTMDSQLDRTEPLDPRAAAAGGAVVLVNAGRYRSDAIIITADGSPALVHLPNLSWADTEKYTEQLLGATYDGGEMGVTRPERPVVPNILEWLWTSAVEPILDALPAARPQRVWWLPIGMLGLFPLHAAGTPGRPGALDAVVSSYTPTLRALAHARARKPTTRHQLAVAVQDAPGLPGTAAEIAELRADRALADHEATVDGVRTALHDATWAHFSCHAGIDLLVPSQGGLRLYDGVLPVAAISRLRLRHAELAYLSACSTSHRGIRHADESIHLASAFQSAGFRHVIAGLWPLNDRVAVRAARMFYRAMPADAAADTAAAVLRDVTIALRSRYPDHPAAWAALIHSGP
jgi:tetratricopeptide (TPR) repeat protein